MHLAGPSVSYGRMSSLFINRRSFNTLGYITAVAQVTILKTWVTSNDNVKTR